MRTLDDSIMELLKAKLISPETAYEKAINKDLFKGLIKSNNKDIFS